MPSKTGIQRAVEKFDGSPTKLADAIGGDVKRQHVEHWLRSGNVPPQHCPAVRDLTGVALWDMRPDDWHRIWPMVIGAKGAPKVPVDSVGNQTTDRATAPQAASSRRTSDDAGRQDKHKDSKPSNQKEGR